MERTESEIYTTPRDDDRINSIHKRHCEEAREEWPKTWPCGEPAKQCDKCGHPSTLHSLDLKRGRGSCNFACLCCSCIANPDEDFVAKA